MWIVRLALDKPYTFAVVAILIAIFGMISVKQMSVDIFPRINIPVITCVWTYTGLMPIDMERRVTNVTERAATTTVTGIEHIESLSLYGICVIKLYLQQDANAQESLAEFAAICQTVLKQIPAGATPPLVTAFSATDIPVMQLCVSSKTIPESKLFDFVNNFIRTQLATVQGASLPYPYGGAQRQIMVDIDPQKLASKNISASDVANAINLQNIILPAGTAKLGSTEYFVQLNSSPLVLDQLNEMPVKQTGTATILMKDVANIHDGLAVQTNVVNESGSRAVLQNVIKMGAASTIDVVNRVKAQIPAIENILPAGVDLRILNDQSIFVQESVDEVVREGLTAAGLTALLMLLLLGDWQSTVIVAISIPLSVLSGLIMLKVSGQTLNTMTLGGFALAVGMLVDDATVEVENIHRHMDMVRKERQEAHEKGEQSDPAVNAKYVRQAILDAANEIAVPAFVSTISICIVFTPVLLLTEPAKSLFTPLALAVTSSMIASYFLSRTVVPVMAKYMLAGHADPHHGTHKKGFEKMISGVTKKVDTGFNQMRDWYHERLHKILELRMLVVVMVVIFMGISFSFVPFLGEDFFPTIDGTVLRMHVSAPRGMRVEETEHLVKKVEQSLKKIIPPDETDNIADLMGVPNSGLNLSSSDSVNYTEADAEILVTLVEKHKKSCSYYRTLMRDQLPKLYPTCIFFFQPADIVTQILNAGLAAPIDVQVRGMDLTGNYAFAEKLRDQIAAIPGAVDVHIKQAINGPVVNVNVDREKAAQLGFTQRDVSGSMLVSLSSSFQTAPNFWVNPKNGVSYNLAVQTPQRLISSMTDLSNQVVTNANGDHQLLGNLVSYDRTVAPTIINHYNVQPVVDVLANVEGTDLNSVAQKVQSIVDSYKGKLVHGQFLDLRGQMVSMRTAYTGLFLGMAFAMVLVYLLLVVNFQSWVDPLIILAALPGAMSGIIWGLFLTQTTFSVPALMGAIMSIGVASANSILIVSFAREKMHEGMTALEAALEAGHTRFRPVLMTASAMIIGMVPMAIGSGSGGAQNAPLGRAVIGGLVVATFFTLVWVPVVFSVVHRKVNQKQGESQEKMAESHS